MSVSALLEMAGLGIMLGAAALFLTPDSATAEKTNAFLEALLPGLSANSRVALLTALLALLLVGKNIFALRIVRLQSRFVAACQNSLAQRLFSSALHAKYEYSSALSKDESFGNITRINYICHQLLLPLMQFIADSAVVAILCLAALILFPAVTVAGAGSMLLCAWGISALTSGINRRLGTAYLECEINENHIRQIGIYRKIRES